MKAAVLSVLALLAFAATAQAWAPPPTDGTARKALYLPIAEAAWPGSPCAGHGDAVQVDVPLPAGVHGEQDPGTCNVRIAAGLTAEQFCDALVHELGHAAGYGHTDDPAAIHAPAGAWAYIMYSTEATWQACVAATTPPLRYQAETYVRQLLPLNGNGWRISCTSMSERRPRCRSSRLGAHDRRFTIRIVRGQVLWALRTDQ